MYLCVSDLPYAMQNNGNPSLFSFLLLSCIIYRNCIKKYLAVNKKKYRLRCRKACKNKFHAVNNTLLPKQIAAQENPEATMAATACIRLAISIKQYSVKKPE